MSNIRFSCDWLATGNDTQELRNTAAQFTLSVDDICLTQSQDVWSRTIRDSVLVSVYPLAAWFAASWWRLNYEPLPLSGATPSLDWRMAHEMGAANHGFVWPQIAFVPDGEHLQVWAVPSDSNGSQSVRYLAGLSTPRAIALADFRQSVDKFMDDALSRLSAVGNSNTPLAALWRLVLNDRADSEIARVRRMEAQMGFDPEECPEPVMAEALALEKRMGTPAFSELGPVYGRRSNGSALEDLAKLANTNGLQGRPQVSIPNLKSSRTVLPWQRAVEAAGALRRQLPRSSERIEDSMLYDLLGLTTHSVAEWTPPPRNHASLAVPARNGVLKFIPRKTHRVAKRFEFSRFLADHLSGNDVGGDWLVCTDAATFRQKYQRAFAAEFLCPIKSLIGFLDGDFSESAIEEAAQHFDVSDQTVESLLANNGFIAPRYADTWLQSSLQS